MTRPSIYEFAGGEDAFLALAAAHHQRCLDDPELNHPFSQGVNPAHIENLASYWAEVFGGPARYSESLGGHSAMLSIHAGKGGGHEYGPRFVECFTPASLKIRTSAPPSEPTWSGRLLMFFSIRRRERSLQAH